MSIQFTSTVRDKICAPRASTDETDETTTQSDTALTLSFCFWRRESRQHSASRVLCGLSFTHPDSIRTPPEIVKCDQICARWTPNFEVASFGQMYTDRLPKNVRVLTVNMLWPYASWRRSVPAASSKRHELASPSLGTAGTFRRTLAVRSPRLIVCS